MPKPRFSWRKIPIATAYQQELADGRVRIEKIPYFHGRIAVGLLAAGLLYAAIDRMGLVAAAGCTNG